MNEILGNDVLLEVFSGVALDYIPFLCAKDMSVNITPEVIETTTASSGKWYDYKERRRGWDISLSGISSILGNGRTIFTTVGTANIGVKYQIRMQFTDQQGNSAVLTGKVLLKTASITGNQNEFSGFENAFVGCGAYTLTVNGSQTPIGIGQMAIGSTFIVG